MASGEAQALLDIICRSLPYDAREVASHGSQRYRTMRLKNNVEIVGHAECAYSQENRATLILARIAVSNRLGYPYGSTS